MKEKNKDDVMAIFLDKTAVETIKVVLLEVKRECLQEIIKGNEEYRKAVRKLDRAYTQLKTGEWYNKYASTEWNWKS